MTGRRAPRLCPAAKDEQGALASYTRLAVLSSDHERRMVPVLVRDPADQLTLVRRDTGNRAGPLCRGARRGAGGTGAPDYCRERGGSRRMRAASFSPHA